ncbi:MAG: DUF488 domain-containing protein [Actinomycetota bacterium]|nr:DUF488 domain-containing protein [Actinomycetota bacterium]
MPPTVYTVGHGNRSIDELTSVLASVGVGRLIDVRRFPGSRRHPHFARESLERWLPDRGVGYEWRGEELGGRRNPSPGPSRHAAWRSSSFQAYADHMDTEDFRRALEGLIAEARAGPALAVMCAETLWWKCHRRLISDSLVARGITVIHLVDENNRQPHRFHPSARVENGGVVYDVGVDRELDL